MFPIGLLRCARYIPIIVHVPRTSRRSRTIAGALSGDHQCAVNAIDPIGGAVRTAGCDLADRQSSVGDHRRSCRRIAGETARCRRPCARGGRAPFTAALSIAEERRLDHGAGRRRTRACGCAHGLTRDRPRASTHPPRWRRGWCSSISPSRVWRIAVDHRPGRLPVSKRRVARPFWRGSLRVARLPVALGTR